MMSTPLTLAKAIIYHDVPEVAAALERGDDDINDYDEYGFSPMVEAAIFDKYEVTKFLLRKGAQVDYPDMIGRTALHWAADKNHLRMARLLLEQGANPNAYGKSKQPVLAFPLLRGQNEMKQLLLKAGANLSFARDYIITKLIGHRYELQGQVHIVDGQGQFVLLKYEGFFLEFTLNIIEESLKRFRRNFGARKWQNENQNLQKIADAIARGRQLIKYQHYTDLYKKYEREIDALLSYPLILIPVAYEGHAITCISMGNLWIKIDRGWNSQFEGSVVIYQVTRPEWLTKNFFKHLLYKKHSREYVNEGLNQQIGLAKIAEMPLPAQIIGNCSWANVEGSVAAMMFLLHVFSSSQTLGPHVYKNALTKSLQLFYDWREWDKDRALEECIQDFHHADADRKISKASLLSAVLLQRCNYRNERDLIRAEKILQILSIPELRFVLDSYIKVFIQNDKTQLGENLINVLDLAAPKGMNIRLNSSGLQFDH